MFFADAFIANFVAHHLADYVLQTDDISKHKVWVPGAPTEGEERPLLGGWLHNLLHGLHHGMAATACFTVTAICTGQTPSVLGFLFGLAFMMITHMIIDRRWPVRWLLEHTGSRNFADMTTPIFGMFVTDQALHFVCIWIGSMIQATL